MERIRSGVHPKWSAFIKNEEHRIWSTVKVERISVEPNAYSKWSALIKNEDHRMWSAVRVERISVVHNAYSKWGVQN